MSPSSTLQDRIRQFESMNGAGTKPLQAVTQQNARTQPSYPPVPRVQTTFHNPKISTPPNDIMNAPVSPTASSFIAIKPSVPYVPRKPKIKSPSPSPPELGCKTSFIDLRESSYDERAEWLKITRPPIAPPRMSSQSSGASASSSSRSLSSQLSTPSIQSRSSSNSLTVEHTYPPLMNSTSHSNLRQRQGHVSASSTSSFHSVSLSSDGDAGTDGTATDARSSVPSTANPTLGLGTSNEPDRDRDDTFSFEAVSSADVGSPTLSSTHEWEKSFSIHKSKVDASRLPSRRTPVASPAPSGSTMTSSLTSPTSQKVSPPLNAVRRIPPPPPSRVTKPPPASASSRASVMSTATTSSDRSSIFSAGTVTTAHTSITSCTQLLWPTPVLTVPRKRYESVFFANVNAQRRAMLGKLSPSAAASPLDSHPASPRKGWRGVSVDLVTNPEDNPIVSTSDDEVEGSRLDGRIVKAIWSRSKLSSGKLRDVWNVCALPDQASLDKDGFVKGMWQIDEELKRVQALRSSTVTMIKIASRPHASKWTATGQPFH